MISNHYDIRKIVYEGHWRFTRKKIRSLARIPKDAVLVLKDVIGFCPSILNDTEFKVLLEKLEKRSEKKAPSTDLVDMAKFLLKNNLCQFGLNLEKKKSATAIGARFASPYASTFADNIEADFLEMRTVKL